jgi:hypothetical protein
MLRSRAVAKENPSNSSNTMLILGIGMGFLTNHLFTFQKLIRKHTFHISLVTNMMAMPIQICAVALVSPFYIVSQYL